LIIKLQGEKHTRPTLDLIIFQNKFNTFKHVIPAKLVIFRVVFGKVKQEDFKYIYFVEKLITNIAEQFDDFSFRKQLMLLPHCPNPF